MEDVHFGAEDEMDEDDEDEEEDVEMDFGEETGSEDTSNTGDEGEDDDIEDPTRQPGEVWDREEDDEEDDEDEEDLVEHDEEDDEDEDEEDVNDRIEGVEGDEGDEEMMWQVSHPTISCYTGSFQCRTSMPRTNQAGPWMKWKTTKTLVVRFVPCPKFVHSPDQSTGPIQIVHTEQEDEPEMVSEDE